MLAGCRGASSVSSLISCSRSYSTNSGVSGCGLGAIVQRLEGEPAIHIRPFHHFYCRFSCGVRARSRSGLCQPAIDEVLGSIIAFPYQLLMSSYTSTLVRYLDQRTVIIPARRRTSQCSHLSRCSAGTAKSSKACAAHLSHHLLAGAPEARTHRTIAFDSQSRRKTR